MDSPPSALPRDRGRGPLSAPGATPATVESTARRWEVTAADEAAVGALARALSIHPLAARVLAARGFADPEAAGRFLSPRLEDLPDPFTMRGMDAAVDRLVAAVEGGERIACYGDYDVDGVTSTTLLAGVLAAAGAIVATYIPHRLVEGYGLNAAAVAKLAAEGARLIV